MTIESFIVALLIWSIPISMHMSFMMGSILLTKISTRVNWFDRTFNRYPLAFSIIAGACGAAAHLARPTPAIAYALLVVAVVMLILDWGGCAISFYKYVVSKKR